LIHKLNHDFIFSMGEEFAKQGDGKTTGKACGKNIIVKTDGL